MALAGFRMLRLLCSPRESGINDPGLRTGRDFLRRLLMGGTIFLKLTLVFFFVLFRVALIPTQCVLADLHEKFESDK